jgi:hypothetical protein
MGKIMKWRILTWQSKIISNEELGKLYQKHNIEYPQENIPEHAQRFVFELSDYRWASFYSKIASRTCIDEGDYPRTPQQRKVDNFYGLMGERAIIDRLRFDLNLIHYWNERTPRFFEHIQKEPFDIAIPKKDGTYYTLEIKCVKEPKNHVRMMIPEKEWKKSDFAIAVKMLRFDLSKKKGAIGFIAGYMTKQEILKLPISTPEEYDWLKFSCRMIHLTEIPHPIQELWEKLKKECITWKSA